MRGSNAISSMIRNETCGRSGDARVHQQSAKVTKLFGRRKKKIQRDNQYCKARGQIYFTPEMPMNPLQELRWEFDILRSLEGVREIWKCSQWLSNFLIANGKF
jgi:hypothetical protein